MAYKSYTFFILVFLLEACSSSKQVVPPPSDTVDTPIFQQVSSASSGLTFANTLTHDVTTKANLFDFDYFYNGAGVGIADLNNDGLEDIFFCGNQEGNRLYLNKGDLVFEDITDTAQVNVGKFWANGVTFADVNRDGWLDIYVSQGGPHELINRMNLLYINNQDLTFTESSSVYGLDDVGLSTQSAFFDYDRDGDLDCIVMNESEFYGMDPIKFHQILLTNKSMLERNSCHLYEQVDGRFVDVTEAAGLLRPAFGLGLVVSDVNDDGWQDIYVANDYYIPDFMFINQKNKKFVDEIKTRTTQLSFFGMGSDIADINNDTKQDIFVLDMASQDHVRSKTLMASMNVDNFNLLTRSLEFQHQYMFNSLQVNLGDNRFRNIAHLTGAAKTDWSWSVLMNDFDNDALKDIFVTNGYRRYALDNDFKNQVLKTQSEYTDKVPDSIKLKLYDQMPTEKLANLLFLNKDDFNFQESAMKNNLAQPSYSNGAATADLDGDGDLEIVTNNIDEEAFLYKNLSVENTRSHYLKVKTKGALSESFPKIYAYHGGYSQMMEAKRVRGYFSSVSTDCIFGLGKDAKVDSLVVRWPSGKVTKKYGLTADQTITIDEKEGTNPQESSKKASELLEKIPVGKLRLFYKHQENLYNDFEKEILLPYKQSSLGPFISASDNHELIYVSGAKGQPGRIFRWEGERFAKVEVDDFDIDVEYEDMEALFLDLDQDGDQDLYVVSGGNSEEENSEYYEDRVYLYVDGTFKRSYAALPEPLRVSGKTILAIDYDQDGDMDIITGNRIVPQSYPIPGRNQVLENKNGVLVDVTSSIAPTYGDFGITNEVIVTDFNGDGLMDFIAVGEWTGIGLFRNEGGSFKNVASEYGLENLKGLWFDVEEADLNADGRPDYLLGNIGLNTKFKTSSEKPFKLFAHDFDTNGTLDIVLSNKYKDEYVPVRGKECSSQQMPFISEKYDTYEDFANATVYDIFAENIDSSLVYEATTFASMVLLSNEDGGYEHAELPAEAQFFPILDCEVLDVNGREEVIAIGNIYDTEVETPRWDGGTGALISYNGGLKGETLRIQGNVKDLELITSESGLRYLIAAKNNDLMSVYKIRNDN